MTGSSTRADAEVAVITSVASEKALSKLSYDAQGDPDLNLRHNLRLREANRDNPGVLAALQAFWDSAMLDVHPELAHKPAADGSGGYDESYDAYYENSSASAVLTRTEYLHIFVQIAKTLDAQSRPKGKGKASGPSDAELLQLAEAAWSQDTDGETLTFDRGQWYESLFELADIYTTSVNAVCCARALIETPALHSEPLHVPLLFAVLLQRQP